MELRRIDRIAVGGVAAVLGGIVLTSAAARTYDTLTQSPGATVSPADLRQLRGLATVLRWDTTSAQYRDAAIHVPAIGQHFRRHPAGTLAHVLAGTLLLCLAPFQLARRIRQRAPRWHRWSGRLALVAATVTGLTGLYFGVGIPYAGLAEAIPSAVFGTLFLASVGAAYGAARRRDFRRHREWMLRMLALAVGVGTIRLAGLPLAALGVGVQDLIGWSFALGWTTTLAVTELWIRRTRDTAAVIAAVAAGPPARAA